MTQEIFVEFYGYLVGNHGTVLSKRNQRLMNAFNDKDGYKRISLFFGEKQKKIYLHRLVYLCHVGDIQKNKVCRHIDGNKTNNNYLNLSIGSQKQNIEDKLLHGTWQAGDTHPSVKYTDDVVVKIQKYLAFENKLTAQKIADKFDVPKHLIDDIKRGKRKTRIQRIKEKTS